MLLISPSRFPKMRIPQFGITLVIPLFLAMPPDPAQAAAINLFDNLFDRPPLLPISTFDQADMKELNEREDCTCHSDYTSCEELGFCWPGCGQFIIPKKDHSIPNYWFGYVDEYMGRRRRGSLGYDEALLSDRCSNIFQPVLMEKSSWASESTKHSGSMRKWSLLSYTTTTSNISKNWKPGLTLSIDYNSWVAQSPQPKIDRMSNV